MHTECRRWSHRAISVLHALSYISGRIESSFLSNWKHPRNRGTNQPATRSPYSSSGKKITGRNEQGSRDGLIMICNRFRGHGYPGKSFSSLNWLFKLFPAGRKSLRRRLPRLPFYIELVWSETDTADRAVSLRIAGRMYVYVSLYVVHSAEQFQIIRISRERVEGQVSSSQMH